MAAIHHQTILQTGFAQLGCGLLHSFQVVIAALAAAAQHEVAVGIARGADDRGMTIAIDAEEVMRLGRRLHGIDRDGGAAVGAVLVADRHRQP